MLISLGLSHVLPPELGGSQTIPKIGGLRMREGESQTLMRTINENGMSRY